MNESARFRIHNSYNSSFIISLELDHPARVPRLAEHLERRTLGNRMADGRFELPERNQDEPPLRQPLVRDGQCRGARDDIVIEQDINVNRARALAPARPAAHRALDRLDRFEQPQRRQLRISLRHAVDKPRLRPEVHGFGLIERGSPADLGASLAEHPEGPAKVGDTISKVRTKREVDTVHWGLSVVSCQFSVFSYQYFPCSAFGLSANPHRVSC